MLCTHSPPVRFLGISKHCKGLNIIDSISFQSTKQLIMRECRELLKQNPLTLERVRYQVEEFHSRLISLAVEV